MSNERCSDCALTQDTVLKPVENVNSTVHVPSQYDPLDASTFMHPPDLPAHSVTIEFCDRCRWLHRASWVCTELLLTFSPPLLKGTHLIPLNSDDSAGRFRIWLSTEQGQALIWDRKIEGSFPEMKVLKQRLRDQIAPGRSLGHSDKDRNGN